MERERPPAAPESMLRRIPGVLRYLLHVDSLLAMGVMAIVLSAIEWVGALPHELSGLANVLARLLWCAYFYLVAGKAAMGKLRLPVLSDYRDTWGALILPLGRVTLATSWYWVLFFGLSVLLLDFQLVDFLGRFQAHPLLFLREQAALGYLLLGVGMIDLPLAVVAALVGGSVRMLLDPLYGLRLVVRAPRGYSITFGALIGLGLVGFSLEALGEMLAARAPVPLAAPVIRYLLRLWVPLAQARLLGEFVCCYRDRLAPAGRGE